MSITSVPYPKYYSDRWNYSIQAASSTTKRLLQMQVPESMISTSSLPATHIIISKLEPRILKSKCYNQKHLPFRKEVKRTETAHLFEHILLEYLCQEQIRAGSKSAKFSGWTSWNWKNEEKGIFHIEITGNKTNDEQFARAVSRSVMLFETILSMNLSLINSKQIGLDYLFVKRMHE